MKKQWRLYFLLLTVVFPALLWGQTRQITGKVTNQRGEPLAAASVQVKGTNNNAVTDNNGIFSIEIQGNDDIIIVTSAGYQAYEMKAGSSSSLSIMLKEAGAMEEVIITAFGVKKEKRALGYSAQTVKGEDIVAARQPNIINAMQGKVAGVQINSMGGAPGQGARIIIRGINSLDPNANNQPLFVIDGVVMDNSTIVSGSNQSSLRGMSNRVADINPDDVESISVLKGGAATALYGSLGSNGVVVINTKSAKEGRMRIDFSTTYGIDNVNKFPDVQNKYTQGFNGIYDSVSFWPSWGPTIEAAKARDKTHPDQIYNHYKQGYQQGSQFRTSINMSGGTEAALLTSSISYFNQKGAIPNTDHTNISFRLGGKFKLSKKLFFTPSINYINSGGLRYNADRFNESLTYWSPRWSVQDYINPNGTMKTYLNNNPVFGTATNQLRDKVNRVLANGLITYKPLSWLSMDYRLGIDTYSDFRRYTAPGPIGVAGEIPYEDNGLGFVNEQRIGNTIINSNLIATASNQWTKNFNTVTRIGHDLQDYKFHSLEADGKELDIPDLLSLNNTKFRTNNETLVQSRLVSVFGDITFSWSNFLYLTVTGRKEWTSTLSTGNNSYFYPSVSLSYIFTDMFKLPDWLSFGKLRASYAEIGKGTTPYRTNSYFNASVLQSNGQVLWTRSNSKGDANLKPERTKTLEFGTDLRFFRNRLGIDFSWYKMNSIDQIIPVSVSPATGYTQFILNSGEIENKGIELSLNAVPIETREFRWNVGVNFSANRNKVLSLREGLTEIVIGSQFGYAGSTVTMKYVPGLSVGNMYGTTYQRYYDKTIDDKVSLYKDLPIVMSGSGTSLGFPVRDNTQRLIANSQPKWIGGISNTFSWKGFMLYFLFDTQQGQYRYNQLDNFMSAFGIAKYTEDRENTKVFEGVLANGTPNTKAVWLGQATGPDGRNYGAGFYRNFYRNTSENFIEDASWTRLRTLSLTYNLPSSVLGRSGIKGASVTLTGNNLLLFTDYSGYDPETSSNSAGSNVDGFTGFTFPAIRSFLFTINLNF